MAASGSHRARLAELGITLPSVVPPLASYIPAQRSGSLVFTSGQVPAVNGTLPATGKVGGEVDPDTAKDLARICALNALAAVDALVGIDAVVRVVKVVGFVASVPEFTGQPGVVNGASDLLGEVFGEAGAHARSAVGVVALPLDAPVEVEIVVEVTDGVAPVTDAVPVRDASTVVLLRDGTAGIEAWLLTRVVGMVFAAGKSVFPGGRVEPADADLPFAGDVAASVARFADADASGRAAIGAAARETFEETGVLLTTPPADLPDARAAVESGALPFGDLLREHGLAVDADALRPWARWVTPEGEVRRYDTRFFVGALPDGAVARDVTSESSVAQWVPVALALEQAAAGERQLMPPTFVTLRTIAGHATVADVLAAAAERVIEPVRPTLSTRPDGTHRVELADGQTFDITL